jgi:2-polyprenyl-3-methyl-5-hydroxy-6-metoxy-1,4-benzoquinol methylase
MHTPAYLLRRHAVLRALTRLGRQRILEVGCGRGDLLARLAADGWEGMGLEISATAAPVAETATAAFGARMRVVRRPEEIRERFPLVIATEVLEHIPDDAAALRQWREWVAPGGRLLLTVPAHMHYWTLSDELGGHQRRYERAGLTALVVAAGFELETHWSFGFPLTAITTRFRDAASRERLARAGTMTPEERTLVSSFDSTRGSIASRLLSPLVEGFGLVAHWAQVPFLESDRGASYLVVAKRVG